MKSYLIDSNVLLRLIVDPESEMGLKSRAFFKKIEKTDIKGILSLLVVNETLWILQRYYKYSKAEAVPKIIKIASLKNIEIQEVSKQLVHDALQIAADKNVDFTDAYLHCSKKDSKVFSFDRDFSKLAKK